MGDAAVGGSSPSVGGGGGAPEGGPKDGGPKDGGQMESGQTDVGQTDGGRGDGDLIDGRVDADADGAHDGALVYISEDAAENLRGVILGATAAGDICPAGSWTLSISGEGTAATILLSKSWSGPSTGTESCTITWEMDVPAGYQMSAPLVMIRGFASNATLQRTYSFDGVGSTSSIYSSVLPNDSYQKNDLATGLWSPSCADTRRVRFVAKLEPGLSSAQDLLSVDSIDIDTSWRGSTVDYRTCGSTAPVQVAPGTAGQYCAGPHKRACSAPLSCELSSLQEDWEGKCVDPNETVAPRKKDESCGGVRPMHCENDLVCRYMSQKEIEENVTGTCSSPVSDAEEICTAVPQAIPCKSGLFCVPSVYSGTQEPGTCKVANGTKGSFCGATGMPSCNSDLVCTQDHKCAVPKGKLGAACNPPALGCDAPLQCIQSTCSAP